MTATLTPEKAIDFVKSLPAETKGDVVMALLNEFVKPGGGQSARVTTSAGESYTIQIDEEQLTDAQKETRRLFALLPPEIQEKLTAPLPDDFDPDDSYSIEEIDAIIAAEVNAESRRSQPSA
jgi:hypothetical protein